jgi:hypothetical protein
MLGMPCDLSIRGPGTVSKTSSGSIKCLYSNGCHHVVLTDVTLTCHLNVSSESAIDVYGSYLLVENSSFSGCASTSDGSFIRSYYGALVVVKDSSFVNGSSEGFGGAISGVESIFFIISSQFVNCSSVEGGGAVSIQDHRCYGSTHQNSNITIAECKFSGCFSNADGGAISCISGDISISSSQFTRCQSEDSGGAVSFHQVFDGKILDCTFQGNAADGLGGGAVYIQRSNATLVGLQSSHNQAKNGGGGFLLWGGESPPAIHGWCGAGMYGVKPECSQVEVCQL